jgi:IS4 transposase
MKFLEDALSRFASKTPISVMTRATIEHVLAPAQLDDIFQRNAVWQYQGELLFSTVADIMGQVVLQIHPSVNAAYLERKEELGLTVKSVYDKLKGIEPPVIRALLRETSDKMKALIDHAGGPDEPLIKGYRTRIVDGNHLRRTDRRIGELRPLNVAPLPGKSLVVYDPAYRLAVDVLPCEDGHAQERSLLPELLNTVEAGDLWIADRNFCTIAFLFGIAERRGKFIIRHHGNLPFEPQGRRRRTGRSETGTVYEQAVEITDDQDNTRTFRRITIELDSPTRDNETAIHLLTNLPKRISGVRVSELYRDRWTIETAFQEVAENLAGEIKTLGYPKAALFAFSMAFVSYNVLSVVRSAVKAVHGTEEAEQLSSYYMCHEIATVSAGMSVVLPGAFWRERYGSMPPAQLAAELKWLAGQIPLRKFKKNAWKQKKKPPLNHNKKNRGHQSTFRILKSAGRDPAYSR